MSIKIVPPAIDDPRVLRYVEIEAQVQGVAPYRLLLWDDGTYPNERWRTRVGCAFYREPDAQEPFMVSYVGPGMGQAIDTDKVVQDALGCFTVRPGDTDSEWFADYTPAQLEWAKSYECEALSMLTLEAEDDSEHMRMLEDEDGHKRLVFVEVCEQGDVTSYTPVFRDLLDY